MIWRKKASVSDHSRRECGKVAILRSHWEVSGALLATQQKGRRCSGGEEMGEKCLMCEKDATANLQKLWVRWEYDAREDKYSTEYKVLDIEPLGDDNLHLCDDCVKLWEQGEI